MTGLVKRIVRLSLRAKIALGLGVILGSIFILLMLQIDMQLFKDMTLRRTLFWMLLDLSLMVAVMTFAVVRRSVTLSRRARDGAIGTRLQSRIIMMFCVIAIIPTISVSLFSAYFFNFGIKTWFDARVSQALESSLSLAGAYYSEHTNAIRSDANSMASVMANKLPLIEANPQLFNMILNEQIDVHRLSEAVIFDHQSRVVSRTALSFSLAFERLREDFFTAADAGKVAVFGDNSDKIQAVLKISSNPRLYMLVSRLVDPAVLEHIKSASKSMDEYQQLQRDIAKLQQQFFMIFIMVALMVLLASVWMGMLLSMRLIDPLLALMKATERVRGGDYSSKVPEGRADDEIANLGRTFNRMTEQLEAQRHDLMEANRLADERRRFTEAVLSGVSAGIIALDTSLRITLNNRTACELLGIPVAQDMHRKLIFDVLPEVGALIAQAQHSPDRVASGTVVLEKGKQRTSLHVQVVAEQFHELIEGFIVTFDDITQLVAAQRSAAWADVARRVAHEIKNPLTPITLSAERLRKKFGPEITSDRETYDRYLDTIARHSRDIGRMVEEFVSFARVPAPNFRDENLVSIIRKSAFSEQTVHPEIHYQLALPDAPVTIKCDEAQIGQILTNLLKNAAEALDSFHSPLAGESKRLGVSVGGSKSISMTLSQTEKSITLTIRDNGPGFPPDTIATLTDPYVTTRAKGTGLGLSIVKRTMEDHGGSIALANAAEGGAKVVLTFPRS